MRQKISRRLKCKKFFNMMTDKFCRVNIVVAMQVDENLGVIGKSSRPQAKVIIKKKTSAQLPKRFGSVIGKKPSTVM